MQKGKRRYDKNRGWIHLKDQVADDQYIVGAVIVTMDEFGNYDSVFVPESLDQVPSEDVQADLGGMVATAFEIANLTKGVS